MIRLGYVLLAIGIVCYGAAVFFLDSDTGEVLSDIGNAVLLITTVLLLLNLLSARAAPRG